MKAIDKKPRIAIITLRNSYIYGGIFSSVKEVHKFCSQYFDPTVFFLGFDHEISANLRAFKFVSSTKPLTFFGMNCVEIGSRWAFWEPGHYAFTVDQWKALLKDYDYFFVVSGTCIAAHPLVLLDKKFVMWASTPYNEDRAERVKELSGIYAVINRLANPFMNRIEKNILTKASYIFALSTYSKIKFSSILGKPRAHMSVCGYPITVNKLTNFQNSNEPIIIAVGRFSDPRKNIDMLIRAFEKIHKNIPQAKLYIIGKKPSEDKLSAIAALPCASQITFTGQVSQADLNKVYHMASLMLITSHQEGLGISGLEALARGVPIVATDCGGTRDYVIDDYTGYLVAQNDDEQMAQKSLYIFTTPELHAQMARNALQFVEETFSEKKIYDQFKQGLVATYPELQELFAAHDKKNQDALSQGYDMVQPVVPLMMMHERSGY